MTFDSLERIRLYVGAGRQVSKQAAYYAHQNGYHELGLRHENEAQMAALILQDLAREKTDAR